MSIIFADHKAEVIKMANPKKRVRIGTCGHGKEECGVERFRASKNMQKPRLNPLKVGVKNKTNLVRTFAE